VKKIAFFVEGQTEQLFVEHLLCEVATKNCLEVEKTTSQGRRGRRAISLKASSSPSKGHTHYALVVDCGSDSSVSSDILENYDSLAQTFDAIVGVRDVYPSFLRTDIPKLRRLAGYGLKTKPIEVTHVLATMEIESWFIAEHTHFLRLHHGLSVDAIRTATGVDPSGNVEEIDAPADRLDAIYQVVGFRYRKKKTTVQRTLSTLDFAEVYLGLPSRVPSLALLTSAITTFLTP